MDDMSREKIRGELTRRVDARMGNTHPISPPAEPIVMGVIDDVAPATPLDDASPPREVAVKQLFIVLAGSGCPGCDEIQEEYKKEIAAGDITVVSVQDDKGIEIVMALGLYALPVLVAESVEGEYLVVT